MMNALLLCALPIAAPEPSEAVAWVQYGSSAGTGTAIAVKGGRTYILTAAHVAEGPGVRVTIGGKTYPATYIAGSSVEHHGDFIRRRGPDLALVAVDAELPTIDVAERRRGSRVRMFGFGGGRLRELIGQYVGPDTYSADNFLTTLPTESGDSGAGVLDEDGKLIGVHAGRDVGGRRARHVTLATIRDFLDRHLRQLPVADSYAAAYSRVLAGERVTYTGTPPGLPYGTYDCYLEGGRPTMVNTCADGSCPLKR